jgi:hypothetical protein
MHKAPAAWASQPHIGSLGGRAASTGSCEQVTRARSSICFCDCGLDALGGCLAGGTARETLPNDKCVLYMCGGQLKSQNVVHMLCALCWCQKETQTALPCFTLSGAFHTPGPAAMRDDSGAERSLI